MRSPIITLREKRADRGQHAGLLLQRYLCENATGDGGDPEEKRSLLHAAISAAANTEVRSLYRGAFERWQKSLPELTAATILQTQGRLIVGLGSENVLETGIRLHHTYGMPVIPGSALKGLAAHYCDQVWGRTGEKFKKGGSYHQLLFGKTDDSGCIVFHDAWFVPGSEKEPLKLDVMTPHHSGWNNVEKPEPPTDFDRPIPVPFLSVAGKFLVVVSWHGPEHKEASCWTIRALELLRDALFNWGVGGKTSSGYGRFDKERWDKDQTIWQQEAEKQRKEEELAAGLAVMNPTERKIKEYLDSHPNMAEARVWLKLFEELKRPDGRFRDSEGRRIVAEQVKKGMQEAKVWKDKGKDGERKKFIEGILGDNS